ncbi:hypothetical protein ACA910_014537 [Epithemia clementina (nom. ined.)]
MARTAPTLVAAFSPPITVFAAAAIRQAVGTEDLDHECLVANLRSPLPRRDMRKDSPARSFAPISTILKAVPNGGASPPHAVSKRPYKHVMAILSVPCTSIDRIANEAILETAIAKTDKLSVVLRSEDSRSSRSLVSLRGYVGEIYSQLWDLVMDEFPGRGVPDVVVYPQNLPNTAPESWIDIQPDLDCVCTHDSLCGWVSEEATGRGERFRKQGGAGRGGLKEHVDALNAERLRRKLNPVVALPPERWPIGAQVQTAQDDKVIFLDDEPDAKSAILHALGLENVNGAGDYDIGQSSASDSSTSSGSSSNLFLSGAPISSNDLFESVAVGGTFDGLHFGHRKLLTIAVSSVQPMTGRLLVGITEDDMLKHKTCSEDILKYEQRAAGVYDFLKRLAPGCLNRIKIVPIKDRFGPPGQADLFFDALVLSHEVLETGYHLNKHRELMGLNPLYLLCTRRTEARGMSSTALRKARTQASNTPDKSTV